MLLFNQYEGPDAHFVREMERLSSLVVDMEQIQRGMPLQAMAGDDAPVLDRWILARRTVPCLVGLSTGHPELVGRDRAITTSDVWLMSDDMAWARTASRWYKLGRPREHFGLDV